MADSSDLRTLLHELKQRLVRGDIDESTYERRRALILEDLSPEEREALTPSPRPVSRKSVRKLRAAIPLGLQASLVPRQAPTPLEPGAVLMDQWRLVREIGRGGFGAVFEVEDLRLNQRLALKVLDPALVGREEMLARFRREVSLSRSLSHPRIVRVYDYREEPEEELALLTMELIGGCSVREVNLLAKKTGQKVPLPLAREILGQTLDALEAAHGAGVIHRDVTPNNVLLAGGNAQMLLSNPEGDPIVKLVDFGIAGLVSRSELSEKSRVLGTAAYVAPEVLSPDAEVGPEADLYGAGAVAYELLTGVVPVGRFPSVREARGEVGAELDELVLALLDVRPGARPKPKEALRVLAGIASGAVTEKKAVGQAPREGDRQGAGAPPPNASALDLWRNPKDGLEYVYIPPGSFEMGASPGDDEAGDAEKPRHRVRLTKGFWLCRTAVTAGAYRKYCDAMGMLMPEAPDFNPNWQNADHPVVNVNWNEAKAYCEWLGGRLPTEAEWEYAARAGTGTKYWWGDGWDGRYAWFCDNSGSKTHPVGEKPANPWNLYDVLGNVWEWCEDWWEDDYYQNSPSQDPKGPSSGSTPVLRGGSWRFGPIGLRASYRNWCNPGYRDDSVGFRSVVPTR